MAPVLTRDREEEYLEVRLPDGEVQCWQEVEDFSASTTEHLHYTLDSQTGTLQFGPLIREPARLRQASLERERIQGSSTTLRALGAAQTVDRPRDSRSESLKDRDVLALPEVSSPQGERVERQYGKIPPLGAELVMVSYRWGGGEQGNVERDTLTVLKSSLPYVNRVTNYDRARGGINAQSLSDAVMQVPQLLRTRETAVMPEDFERVAKHSSFAIARAHCLTAAEYRAPGIVRLLIVPRVAHLNQYDWSQGMSPEKLRLWAEQRDGLQDYLKDRAPLGIHIQAEEPDYVGVSVRVSVLLSSMPRAPQQRESLQQQIMQRLRLRLYQYLNPVIGDLHGQGWKLGRRVYVSDVVSICQQDPNVHHVGEVKLYEVQQQGDETFLFEAESVIDPGPKGLICSWAAPDMNEDPAHTIRVMEEDV
jgi:predicted phage baseplate assembly protein